MDRTANPFKPGDYLQTRLDNDVLVYEVVSIDVYTPMIGFTDIYLNMIIRAVNGDNSLNALMRTCHKRELRSTPYNIHISGFRKLTPLEVLGMQV